MNDPAGRLKKLTESMALAIHDIRERPSMWIGVDDDPRTADVALHLYHSLWAQAEGRSAEFDRTYESVRIEEGCRTVPFHHGWQVEHPGGSKRDATLYVFACWRRVTERLGIERPPFP
jgi:hypothetical protein